MMIATFRETIESLRDLEYGKEIIKKTVGQSFWYWLKYPLAITIILSFVWIAVVIYFTPRISRLADQYLPEVDLTVRDGMATTTMKQPLVWEGFGSVFIFNLKGSERDLDGYKNGLLILEDRVIAKGGRVERVIKWSEFEHDFQITKQGVVDTLSKNKFTILVVLLVIMLLRDVLGFGFLVLSQTIIFLVWSVLFWIVARIFHKPLKYLDIFKLSLYAAVPALLVDLLNGLLPGSVLSTLSMGVFVFYGLAWLYRLSNDPK